MKKARPTNPIEAQIGRKICARRQFNGMSQTILGSLVGVTFQQIQKYERGENRISASRLQKVATALGVPLSYFFEYEPNPYRINGFDGSANEHQKVMEFLASPDGRALNRAFRRICDDNVRRRVVALVAAIAHGGSF